MRKTGALSLSTLWVMITGERHYGQVMSCLLYTSDAADDSTEVYISVVAVSLKKGVERGRGDGG